MREDVYDMMQRRGDNGRHIVGKILGAGRPGSSGVSKVRVYGVRQRRDVIVGCSVAAVAALVALTVCFYRCRRRSRRRAVSDPEQGDAGLPSEQGRLAAVLAPPPVPDLCPYSPQMDELTSVGQSPTEQYAANCRAMRAAGTGTGSRAFDVGGPGGNRCALDGPGGSLSDSGRTGRPPDSVPASLEPYDVETMTVDVVEEDFNNDDDDDEEEEEEEEEEDVETMEVTEVNNNLSSVSNTNGNNNVDDEESEHGASTSEEGLLTASTISSASSGSKDDGNAIEGSTTCPAAAGSVLELSLAYDTKHCTLIVSVEAIRRLQSLVDATEGRGSVVSPYVRLQVLLPDGRRLKAKTRVVASTAAVGADRVELGETFAFRDLTAGLPGTRLHAAVLGFDRFSKDSVLGDVTVSLDDNRLLSTLVDRHGILETFELNLQPRTAASQSPINKVGRPLSVSSGRARSGELLLSIGHQPGAVDKLTVVVLKARNLPSTSDLNNECLASTLTDVYVKVYMLYKGRRLSRKQTRTVACGVVAPSVAVFNEALLFDMDPNQSLAETAVELVLVDCHRVTKDEYVGRLVVSPFDGDRHGNLPGNLAAARGPHTGGGGGECATIGGGDRPVAVWHRLAAW